MSAREASGGRREEAKPTMPPTQFGPVPSPKFYVSYAWRDASDPAREQKVDAACEAGQKRGTLIIRDRTTLRTGDRISQFMQAIGLGDRIFVFLCDKYLKSWFCMYELFEIWRNSRQDEAEFVRRVRVFTLDDVQIWSVRDRLEYARWWNERHGELKADLQGHDPTLLSERDFRQFRAMRDFAHHVGDILALFADTVLPRSFDEFLKYGFDDPPLADPTFLPSPRTSGNGGRSTSGSA